jgi:hypothetical protein
MAIHNIALGSVAVPAIKGYGGFIIPMGRGEIGAGRGDLPRHGGPSKVCNDVYGVSYLYGDPSRL